MLHAFDDGFGTMQLTKLPIPVKQLWKWTANVAEEVSRAQGFAGNAATCNDQVQQGLDWNQETGGTPPNQGTAFPMAPEFTEGQVDRETWARYNSPFRYHSRDPIQAMWVNRNTNAPGNKYANDLTDRKSTIQDSGIFPPLWGN